MKMIVLMMQLFHGVPQQPIGQWEGPHADTDCIAARERIETIEYTWWFLPAPAWTYECVVMAVDGVQ